MPAPRQPGRKLFLIMDKPRRIAILVELPKGTPIEMVAFRRMIKALLRQFGLKCVGLRPPEETTTFKDEAQ
jgi:hypothetical protein